jgi:hypothetical protein
VPSFNDNVCPETVTDINAIKANENIAKIDPVMCFIIQTLQELQPRDSGWGQVQRFDLGRLVRQEHFPIGRVPPEVPSLRKNQQLG